MARTFPESHKDLLADASRAFAVLATVMPDGSPQATVLWFDTEGDLLRVNTARGRVKERNMSARSKVALVILDPQVPGRYLQIRGTVVGSSEEGAREHIRQLHFKYTGDTRFDIPPGQVRVTFTIRPDAVSADG
ncbi:MAG: PPOX class F420-dependent oxidoreductase [Actinobacteria bacterium]|nr:PPOX class F420-dependent oxidoreductase [Actinomycetota bacterium]